MESTLNKAIFFNFITELEVELIDNLPHEIPPDELSQIEESKKKLLELITEIKGKDLILAGQQFKTNFERLDRNRDTSSGRTHDGEEFSIAARELDELSDKDREILKQNISDLNKLSNELETPEEDKR